MHTVTNNPTTRRFESADGKRRAAVGPEPASGLWYVLASSCEKTFTAGVVTPDTFVEWHEATEARAVKRARAWIRANCSACVCGPVGHCDLCDRPLCEEHGVRTTAYGLETFACREGCESSE